MNNQQENSVPQIPMPTYEEINHGLWLIILGIGTGFLALLKRLVIAEKKALMHEFEKRIDIKLEPIIKDIKELKDDKEALKNISGTITKIGEKLKIL
ncbi:MAG: hypothetical protein EBS06_05495 [Proteobacteria bacterium]|nr:hypothetical protein [Pseudomonadota bacterium]